MTKTTKLFFMFLLVGLLFTLTACSKFGAIQKAFEKDGWTYVEEENNTTKTIVAELEEGNLECTVHAFKKETSVGFNKYVYIIEFKSDKDLAKAFEENGSATLKGLFKDVQESDYVNGNCIFVPGLTEFIGGEALEVFKNA